MTKGLSVVRAEKWHAWILLLFSLKHVGAFLCPSQRPRQSRSKCLLQIIPSEISGLFPAVPPLLEDVSWSDVALYGGLPLAATVATILSQPPKQLVTDQELQEILSGTFLQQSRGNRKNDNTITCLYKASRDGWSATNFHDKVDNCGSGLVVARSALTGQVFGGYNPAGWRSTDDYVTSTAAFLWTKKGSKILKFPVLAGGNAAVFDFATAGPNFGASDLVIGPPKAAVLGGFAGPDTEDITSNAGNLRQARSVAGTTYDTTAAWPARGNLVLSEVEVYGRP